MANMPGPVHEPNCCSGTEGLTHGCVCGPDERCLRGWSAGENIPPMTAEQRAWCFAEIESCGDSTDQGDFSSLSDADLSRQTLSAWRDYCRDKGML